MLKKGFIIAVLYLSLVINTLSKAADGNFEINHAQHLEISQDKITLSGAVSINSVGLENFTLTTNKLVSIKNSKGEFGNIQTFGRSRIHSPKFELSANKIYFLQDLETDEYNLIQALGKVYLKSADGGFLEAPQAIIELDTKILKANGGVISKQFIEQEGKTQQVTIKAASQEINLEPARKGQVKQLMAKGDTITTLPQTIIKSQNMELYNLEGKAQKAIFAGKSSLQTEQGDYGTGEQITYFLDRSKLLVLESKTHSQPAHLQSAKGMDIQGELIKYNNSQNRLEIKGFASRLKIPKNNKQLEIQAHSIVNQETKQGSLLIAKQNPGGKLVHIKSEEGLGWGQELYIQQNKNIPEQDTLLLLVGQAKLIDSEQTLQGAAIQIGPGVKSLFSGFSNRAKGKIPLKKKLTK